MMEHDSVDRFFDNHLYRWNKMTILVIGRWPYQSRKWRVIISFAILSIISSTTIGTVLHLTEIFGNIDGMAKGAYILIGLHIVFVSVINMIVHFDLMEDILRNMMNNWMHLKNEDEMTVFLRQTKKGKFRSLFSLGFMVAASIMYLLKPFTSELFYMLSSTNESHPLKPIHDVQFYIDPHKYYVPMYLQGVSSTFAAWSVFIAIDGYFIMIVYHACAMYDILSYRIHMIGEEYTNARTNSTIDDQEKLLVRRIVECTKYHRHCIRFSESIEKFCNISWILIITPMMLIISVTAVRAILTTNEMEEALTFGLCSACTLFQLFNFSLVGQELLDHSVQIHQTIYNMSWYELPPKAKELLIFMLLRASKPSNITAGKLMPINLSTFGSLVEVSMSYISCILSTTK